MNVLIYSIPVIAVFAAAYVAVRFFKQSGSGAKALKVNFVALALVFSVCIFGAMTAMASGEDERREWLVALGETEAGRNALADYARDEWQLEACFLLGIPPENADLELWIPSLDFSEEGDEVLLGGALRVNGTNVACRLNGRLKVRLSDTLSGASVGEIELQERVLPLPSPIRLPVQHRQFFRLLVD